MSQLPPLIVILGPTASGKSSLAVKLAKRFSGYIISADSRQVYRGMAIGTAMPSTKDRRRVRHFLVDLIRPNETYSLAHYQRDVFRILKDEEGPVSSAGKLPFLVGGTGLYIDVVTQNWDIPKVKPNTTLRKRLEQQTVTLLAKRLTVLDPESAAVIDRHNKRRLVRALEVFLATGESLAGRKQPRPLPFRVLKLGLNPTKHILEKRICTRVYEMFRQGLVAETKRLLKRYPTDLPALSSIGYREVVQLLHGDITKSEAIERIVIRTRQYAKRQMTWFKRDQEIHWVRSTTEAQRLVRRFLQVRDER